MRDYRDAAHYLYVPARGIAKDKRKLPTTAWVKDCPDDIDPRTEANPHTLTYDETDPEEPYIIVGACEGHILDIDVDVGDEHAVVFEGEIEEIETPDGMLHFRSPSGGAHYVLKFQRDHDGISGVDGVDIQGDLSAGLGVVVSPFHHPEYEIVDEPTERTYFDIILETKQADLNNGFGVDLVVEEDEDDTTTISDIDEHFDDPLGDRELTEAQVEDALDHVDSRLDYENWLAVGFAVYDWNSGLRGKRLFEQWSRTNSKWEKERGQRHIDDIWENDAPDGRVSVGTLIKHAREGGWELPDRSPAADLDNAVDIRDERTQLLTDLEAAAEVDSVATQAEMEEDLIQDFAQAIAPKLEQSDRGVGTLATMISEASRFFNKTNAKTELNDAIDSLKHNDSLIPFDRYLSEHLRVVMIERSTDHVQDVTYRWIFDDGAEVETSSQNDRKTHFSWYHFQNICYDGGGMATSRPQPDLRDSSEWRRFLLSIIEDKKVEQSWEGKRTRGVSRLENIISNSEGFGTLEGAIQRSGVYVDDDPNEGSPSEVWVANRHPAQICEDLGLSNMRLLQAELDARGYTLDRMTGVAKRTTVNGEDVGFWILDAEFALPQSYVEDHEESIDWESVHMDTSASPDIGPIHDTGAGG